MPKRRRAHRRAGLVLGRGGLSRRLVYGTALVGAAVLLLSACGGGGGRVYRDPANGFRFNYPTGFRAVSFAYFSGLEGAGGRGVIVVNRAGRAVLSSGSSSGLFVWSDLKPSAVVLTLAAGSDGRRPNQRFNYGASPNVPGVSGLPAVSKLAAHLPLRAAMFQSLKEENVINGAYWRGLRVRVKGGVFAADVYVGPRASKADRTAIWGVVTSLRFPA